MGVMFSYLRRSPIMNILFVITVLMGSVTVSVFAQDSNTSSVTEPDRADATLQIISPKEGEVITGDEVLVKIQTANFTITPYQSGEDSKQLKPVQPNAGHAHIWLDQKEMANENALKNTTPDPTLFQNIQPGDHTLVVELVDSHHESLNPPKKTTTLFKTRSASDVTAEETALALKNVRGSKLDTENELTAEEAGKIAKLIQNSANSLMLWGILGGVILIGGLGFMIYRLRK